MISWNNLQATGSLKFGPKTSIWKLRLKFVVQKIWQPKKKKNFFANQMTYLLFLWALNDKKLPNQALFFRLSHFTNIYIYIAEDLGGSGIYIIPISAKTNFFFLSNFPFFIFILAFRDDKSPEPNAGAETGERVYGGKRACTARDGSGPLRGSRNSTSRAAVIII